MTSTKASPLLSRERAAGYDADVLGGTTALLVGCGALGQNLAMNLALSQVGFILLVDFDTFELHNATRSPLYPQGDERERWHSRKAPTVAWKLRQLAGWSEQPRVAYYDGAVQQLGDSPFRRADVVFSSVDNYAARARLSMMCKKHSVPLVEGGFDGASISFATFSAEVKDACWQCQAGEDERDPLRRSCDEEALRLESEGFVPATQAAAAALGGLMAEAGIRLAHGDKQMLNRRAYCDVHTARSRVVSLAFNAQCSGYHERLAQKRVELDITEEDTVGTLLSEVRRRMPQGQLALPAPYVASVPCSGRDCGKQLSVHRPKWQLERHPRCTACGGTFAPSMGSEFEGIWIYHALSADTDELDDLLCRDIGVVGGSLLTFDANDGERCIVEIPQTRDPFLAVS